ncbi:uncharacterized protein UDID_18478 [Ustilago sp. UG-2017a]|nr:uncharacterized protein UDID_18478 [Ustilago sp. UG-2017a]
MIIEGFYNRFQREQYRDWIIAGLLRDAVTAVSAYPDGLSVVEDGSSCHQAAICKQRQAEYNIKTQEHLLASPDLNPIENIWYYRKPGMNLQELQSKCGTPRSRSNISTLGQSSKRMEGMLSDKLNHCLLDPVPKLRAGTAKTCEVLEARQGGSQPAVEGAGRTQKRAAREGVREGKLTTNQAANSTPGSW